MASDGDGLGETVGATSDGAAFADATADATGEPDVEADPAHPARLTTRSPARPRRTRVMAGFPGGRTWSNLRRPESTDVTTGAPTTAGRTERADRLTRDRGTVAGASWSR
jgi:hypothetical protein